MNTAIIIERFDITLGGAERSVSQLAEQLGKDGIDVSVLAATGKGQDNVKILCRGSKKRVSLKEFSSGIKEHLKDNRYDIIHSTLPLRFCDVYQPRGGSYLQAMVSNAESCNCPIQTSFKKLTHFTNTRRLQYIRAERDICKNSDCVVAALSENVKNHFRQHYSLPEDRITVIPNAVKIEEPACEKERDIFRRHVFGQLNIDRSKEPFVYLFAANNFRLKGLAQLLEAMKGAVANEPEGPIVLAAAGSGDRKKYERTAVKLGIRNRVAFTGSLGHIQNAIAGCDAAVLPTWYDPSSRFILEALAGGKPVITTRLNGASEMFENNRHGIIIDKPSDIKELSCALEHFSKTANANTASNAIISDGLADEISIARHSKQLINLYETILERRK